MPTSTSNSTAGQGDYLVRPGDCLSSIAARHGLFWQTLWDHPDNADLREIRQSPSLLLPGDRLTVPDRAERTESVPTASPTRFVRKGVPARLRLRFRELGEPRAGDRYVLNLDGRLIEGQLDDDGALDVPIPPDARSATLRIEDDPEIELPLGHVDPVDTVTGIQQRLANLGYAIGRVDGRLGSSTSSALTRFRSQQEIDPADGEEDGVGQATRDRLAQVHGG